MSSEEKGGRHTEKFKVKMGAEIGVKECLKLPGAGREARTDPFLHLPEGAPPC